MNKPIIIGIAGPSGSGKSVLSTRVQESLGRSRCSIIAEDAYYRNLTHLSFEERCAVNYDHPDTFEHELMEAHLAELLAGRSVDTPTYDYAKHLRAAEVQHVEPTPVIIVEGILIFHLAELRQRMDLKVFVDVAADICLVRRIFRDTQERGRTMESVLNQYLQTVRPMAQQYVIPSMGFADVKISHGGASDEARDLLCGFIKARLPELA